MNDLSPQARRARAVEHAARVHASLEALVAAGLGSTPDPPELELTQTEEALHRLEQVIDAFRQQLGARKGIDPAHANILIISSSKKHGSGFLDYAEDEMKLLLQDAVKTVTFVPWARQDLDSYTGIFRKRLAKMGYETVSVHEVEDPAQHIREQAQAVFVGGGNTHRLLQRLYEHRLLEPIRERVTAGMP